jgi:hypothetical protein
LALLVAADEQHEGSAPLHEIDRGSRAEINPQLADAVEILRVAKEAGLNACYPLGNLLLALCIGQPVKPLLEFLRLPDFEHL